MEDDDIVRTLKALADPTRFRMVQAIATAGELTCGQVTELFDISQPTTSHHLKILTDAGILIRRSEGKQHFTSVNGDLLSRLASLLPGKLAPVKRLRKRA